MNVWDGRACAFNSGSLSPLWPWASYFTEVWVSSPRKGSQSSRVVELNGSVKRLAHSWCLINGSCYCIGKDCGLRDLASSSTCLLCDLGKETKSEPEVFLSSLLSIIHIPPNLPIENVQFIVLFFSKFTRLCNHHHVFYHLKKKPHSH